MNGRLTVSSHPGRGALAPRDSRSIGRGWRAVWALLLVLAGCNADVAGVGGEGTGSWIAGRIDGFGSVIVAGQIYEDRNAEVLFEIDPRAPDRKPITALRLGMVAALSTASDGSVGVLRVAPILRATVVDIDHAARRFVAGGQTVSFETSPAEFTALEGWRQAADLREGDAVEVHGERDAQGVIRASLLVRLPELAGIRVQGEARSIDPARGLWTIGDQAIDLRAAATIPAGRAVQSGDEIVAYSAAELSDTGVLRADAIAILTTGMARSISSPRDGESVRLSGLLAPGPRGAGLSLLGLPLDIQGAILEAGLATDLQPGRRVTVDGQARAGGIRAQRVRLVDPAVAPEISVTAPVGNFAGPASFALRGNSVDASAAVLSGLSADNLVNGLPVRARGAWRGAALAAQTVEEVPPREGDSLAQAGDVSGYDPSRGRFRLAGLSLPMRLLPSSAFVDLRPGDFVNGRAVIVRGAVSAGELAVTEVRTRPPALEAALVEFTGRAGNVERSAAAGAFDVGPTDFVWSALTAFRGPTNTPADLRDGAVVRVRAIRDGAVWRAIEVDTRDTQPGTVRLRGTVTAWQPPGALRLDGQRVDVSRAVFDPPSLRASLAGADVEVEGVLVDGVVQATRVRDP